MAYTLAIRVGFGLLVGLMTTGSVMALESTIEWDQQRQRIDGFGACDAWFADEIMTHPDREQLLDLLFKRDGGAGLSILRHRVQAQVSQVTDGGMELESSDLDFAAKPWTGLRFVDLALASGAEIRRAQIQFSAKDTRDNQTPLTLWAEAADDAAPFNDQPGCVSARSRGAAEVAWSVPAWQEGDTGPAQLTPDLSPLLTEVLARPGWRSGNAVVIVVHGQLGRRGAASIEMDPERAAELVVELADGSVVRRRIASGGDDVEQNGRSQAAYAAALTKAAFERGCELVWASSWSPPYAWKTSGKERSGVLKREHYQDYADHLEAYRARHDELSGIPLYAISPQNEPGKKPWESCEWKMTDFRDFIRDYLRPTLKAEVKIVAPEETRWNKLPGVYQPIHDDEAARAAVDILAGHGYPPTDPSRDYSHFGKTIWQTEWSYDTSKEDRSIANGVKWASNFWHLLAEAQVSSSHHWWLVNFKDKQQGLISATKHVPGIHVAKRLWTIGNFSKFVRPGWYRVAVSNASDEALQVAAFRSDAEGGEVAVVVINRSKAEQECALNFTGLELASVTPHRTSETEDLQALDPIAAGAQLRTSVPAMTVTTFVGKEAK
ncbi:MAG: hypothetical protein PF961_11120 [Planctomycetota bacterium]|nr:hypothetical protein [Planctomycetota bacterium]